MAEGGRVSGAKKRVARALSLVTLMMDFAKLSLSLSGSEQVLSRMSKRERESERERDCARERATCTLQKKVQQRRTSKIKEGKMKERHLVDKKTPKKTPAAACALTRLV